MPSSRSDSDAVFGGMDVPEDILVTLRDNIARRLTPQPVKIRADLELTCFSYAGIDAIRRALQAGEALRTEAIPIQIRLVAPPLYVMISNATDKSGAIEALEAAIDAIRAEIQKDGGELNVKRKVRARVYRADHADGRAAGRGVRERGRRLERSHGARGPGERRGVGCALCPWLSRLSPDARAGDEESDADA